MTIKEAIEIGVWLFLLGSIVYAHLSYRKLKKVIFNDLKHLIEPKPKSDERAMKMKC